MRIGLDTTRVNFADGGGRYTNEMVANLCRIFPACEFVAFGPTPRRTHSYANLTWVKLPDVAGTRARLEYALRLASVVAPHRLDVFHNLCNYGFYCAPCPLVTTIHDLLTLKFPDLRAKQSEYWLYRFYLPRLLRRTAWIVSDSAQTTVDLRNLWGFTRNVVTVLLGYDRERFRPEGDGDVDVLRRHDLEPGYLLFVGHLVPKKNLGVVIEALSILRAQRRLAPSLVLAGTRGDRAAELFDRVGRAGLRQQVRELGFVADTDLPALYRQARVVLFPSRYEGFGLPVLEAMACGTPVLSSPVGAIPEIVDSREYLCPADDPAEWAEKIARFLGDETSRATASAWGLERAAGFSWERCARETKRVYDLAVGAERDPNL